MASYPITQGDHAKESVFKFAPKPGNPTPQDFSAQEPKARSPVRGFNK